MSKEEAAEFAKHFRSDDDDIQEYARPCPNCEYHRQRAQLWRDEAYKQAGHPLPERQGVEHMSNQPVAWHYPGGKADQCTTDKAYAEKDPAWTPMYYKREWVGLTAEEQLELYKKHDMDGWGHFYNAIEAKLKEKNG
jgi:hypothetical protein